MERKRDEPRMICHVIYEDALLPVNIFKWTPHTELMPQHHHHCFEMGLCLSGSGRFHFGDASYPVNPGDLFIINMLESHIAQSHEGKPCEFIFLNFDPQLLEQEEPELALPFRYYPFHFRNRLEGDEQTLARLRELMAALWQEKQLSAPGYRTAIKSGLLALCVELLRMSRKDINHTAWTEGARNYEHIRPVLQYIGLHYQNDISLHQLSSIFHLSQSQISRLILEVTGRKFKSHLLAHRVQHAKRLLAGTAMSVTDICFECGFQSLATFYRNFKSCVAVSPEDYRRDHYAP